MNTPYRIAAPPEPEAPDPADAYEALLRRRAARSRHLATAICVAVAGLSVIALAERPKKTAIRSAQEQMEARSAERIAETRATIANAELAARAEQARFAAIVGAALDADLGASTRTREPCDVRLPRFTRLHGRSTFPLLVVAKDDRDLPSPSVATLLTDVRRAHEHLIAGRFVEAILYGNALNEPASRLHHDVIVSATKIKRPVRTNPTTYEPGEISGRAYVYDFDSHRITCAGDVHAESSPNVEYTYPSEATAASAQDFSPLLDDDLELQLERAVTADNALFKTD